VELETMIDASFLERVGIELKRAERYRIFVSLIVLDLGICRKYFPHDTEAKLGEIEQLARGITRASDYVALVESECLALLFPETSRQGAEMAARRLTGSIRDHIQTSTGISPEEVIPLEMASYPDAAGAKTITIFLEELAHRSRN
jgi:GGDEF domain-containing protein